MTKEDLENSVKEFLIELDNNLKPEPEPKLVPPSEQDLIDAMAEIYEQLMKPV